jgi:tetratricopeptide (TPR) repeat protein
LSRDPQSHLSPDELAGLAEETESTWQSAGVDPDRDQAKAHAEGCAVCGPRLRDHRSVQARLRSMVSPVASERKRDCPAEEKWTAIAGGVSPAAEAKPLLEHASRCDYCGPLLRAAIEDLNPEISAEEEEFIRQLPSASAAWQQALARKMTGAAAVQAGENVAASVRETELRGIAERDTRSRIPSSSAGWLFASWTLWATPVAAVAVVAVGAAIWIEHSSPSLSATNQLIVQAYGEQRPFELRFPGAGYAPVQQERGEIGPSRSRLDEPPELLEAETRIARRLARHPQDAGWLQAKARSDLFEGQYQSAIEALRQAEAARPEDVSLKIDLATAYYERAGTDTAEQSADYSLALQLLNAVLAKNPNDLVSLFNRAIVYQRQKRYSESIADWQHYLQLDPSGLWAEEARRQLDEALRGKAANGSGGMIDSRWG